MNAVTALPPMKIIQLTAENVKRLVAVSIRPDGALVEITGKNAQGKTSVLDAIWWALDGARNIQRSPIRKGEQKAMIELDLGPIVVTRTFTRKEGNEFTTALKVESADGLSYGSPQAVLDSVLGSMTFDPLKFARMKPAEQYDALRAFVQGIDFDQVDRDNDKDFQRRTVVKQQAKEAAAAASMIVIPPNAPTEEADMVALAQRLEEAHRQNNETEQRRLGRKTVADGIKALQEQLATVEESIVAATQQSESIRDNTIAGYQRQIDQLQLAIENSRKLCDETVAREAASLRSRAADMRAELDHDSQRLANAPPLPDPVPTEPILQEIKDAEKTNAIVARAADRTRHLKTAAQYQQETKDLTESIEARTKAKNDAIAKAALPVPGLGFGSGYVTFNGEPLEQASDAEQLRVSLAIAMQANPKLRVIRIREGEKLDSDGRRLVAEIASAHDYQVWIERVDESGRVGFVMEDGHVRHAVDQEPTA